MRAYVDFYEANQPNPWGLENSDPGLVDKLVEAIVGFTIDIDQVEATWKLNQNHDSQRRRRVIEALRAQRNDSAKAIAELMDAMLEDC